MPTHGQNNLNKPFGVVLDMFPNKKHKFKAIFLDEKKKKIKTTYFGDRKYKDYILYNKSKGKQYADERKELYVKRHFHNQKSKDLLQDPTRASTLSLFILWNEPTITESIEDYLKHFGLELIVNY